MANRRYRINFFTIFLWTFFILFFSFGFVSNAAEIQSEEIITIESRPKIKQAFMLIKPQNPAASVILFAGGGGKIELGHTNGKPTIGAIQGDFLIKTRRDFANHGFMVAVYDVPSDQKKKGMYTKRRMEEKHADDINAVASYLKKQANIPVWLVGTSKGTISAVNGAIRIKENINGLILTSSVTKYRKQWKKHYKTHPNGIIDMDLDKITVPTLIVSHRDDKCEITPPGNAEKLKSALVNSPKVDVLYFTGRNKAKSKACGPGSTHRFYGIEEQVVKAIAEFIKSNF
jgi:pimeloyl-ACP methyl ester carboxylesterase